MYTDKDRSRAHDEVRRREHRLFAHILTPDLFLQAALKCDLRLVCSPLNLVCLVYLALSAAGHPELSFAHLLQAPFDSLRDSEQFPGSDPDRLLHQARRRRKGKGRKGRRPGKQGPHAHKGGCRERSCHHPKGAAEAVSTAAFTQACRRLPTAFWVALFVLLGERFCALYADVVRWGRFRLLALDGTRLALPDYPALRQHFGTASNAQGSHAAQARLVLLLLPLARMPLAHVLSPVKVGEPTLARRLLQGLLPNDLVLLDAGFRSYGVLAQIQQQGAFFCVRLRQKLSLKVVKQLGSKDDVEVVWRPKDSRGQWRKEELPRSLRLRRLTYRSKGYRPLVLLTNVLDEKEVPYARWWGLSVSEEGEVLARGIYNFRWEIETTYRELKVEQKLEGGLRGRTRETIEYEVAGHVLYYLLVRWLLVEAAVAAQVSPLRLSFQDALAEVKGMAPQALLCSDGWLEGTLRPRLLARLAEHQVPQRPGRSYPRGAKQRRAAKRASSARYRRRQKDKARQQRQANGGRKPKPRARPWFGDGWDLRGRQSTHATSSQT